MTIYLKYLQSILLEYKLIRALARVVILKYFWKGPKPFILAKLEKKNIKLKNFVQIIKNVVIVETKANL